MRFDITNAYITPEALVVVTIVAVALALFFFPPYRPDPAPWTSLTCVVYGGVDGWWVELENAHHTGTEVVWRQSCLNHGRAMIAARELVAQTHCNLRVLETRVERASRQ